MIKHTLQILMTPSTNYNFFEENGTVMVFYYLKWEGERKGYLGINYILIVSIRCSLCAA